MGVRMRRRDRTIILRALLTTAMIAIQFGTAFVQTSASQCPDRDRLSADQKLEMLEKPLNRSAWATVACAVAFRPRARRPTGSRI